MSTKTPLALAFPLRGSQLIEASAGTGKTFTISALYLRLVLGHGGEERLRARVAATADSRRDLHRCRNQGAARTHSHASGRSRSILSRRNACARRLIADCVNSSTPEQWPGCANRLDIAAQWMDEAAVSTIHSWCQRMLREHAFDSGSLFTQPWKPTTATCSAKCCAITGGCSAIRCRAMP
jgi:exodeoxyribonuclease V beta subunit